MSGDRRFTRSSQRDKQYPCGESPRWACRVHVLRGGTAEIRIPGALPAPCGTAAVETKPGGGRGGGGARPRRRCGGRSRCGPSRRPARRAGLAGSGGAVHTNIVWFGRAGARPPPDPGDPAQWIRPALPPAWVSMRPAGHGRATHPSGPTAAAVRTAQTAPGIPGLGGFRCGIGQARRVRPGEIRH